MKSINDVTGLKNWRRLVTWLLAGALMSMGLPGLLLAQELRNREAQPAKEITESAVEGTKPPISSPALESEELASSTRRSIESERTVLLTAVKNLSRLSRLDFSVGAVRELWQPVVPQPQASPGNSKAGGLVAGLIGLGLMGAGGYLAAKSKPYEIVTPGFTSCTGTVPNYCRELPAKRTKTGVNPGMTVGIGVIGLGIGVAVAGFRKM